MQIVSNIALISINETLIIQLVSFLLFLFIINRMMFKPLSASMAERDAYIHGLGQEIEDTEQEMGNLLDQLASREASVRAEAFKVQKALEDEGAQHAIEIHGKVQAEIARLKQETEADVQSQVEEAKKSLQAESEALALGVMEKMLDRRISP